MKEPKRYECTSCGFVSSKFKELKFPGITFAVCFKCRGRLKEREEWISWLHALRDRHFGETRKNGGTILERKIN